MSETYTILTALKTQLTNYASLSGVALFTIFEDEIELVNERRKFPFVNLTCEIRETIKAENIRTYDYERRLWKIMITYCVRAKSKNQAMQDIWTLTESVEDGYKSDRTINKNVKDIVEKPEIAVDSVKFQKGNVWIGRGAMIFSVYTDEYIRTY